MPVWALRLLPYGLAALALIGVVLYIDHKGYQRAEDANKLTQAIADKQRAELKLYINQRVKDVEADIADSITTTNQTLTDIGGKLRIEKTTIVQPTIQREIVREEKYRDPSFISSSVLDSLNKARAASSSTCITTPDGRFSCTLPPSQPAQ